MLIGSILAMPPFAAPLMVRPLLKVHDVNETPTVDLAMCVSPGTSTTTASVKTTDVTVTPDRAQSTPNDTLV